MIYQPTGSRLQAIVSNEGIQHLNLLILPAVPFIRYFFRVNCSSLEDCEKSVGKESHQIITQIICFSFYKHCVTFRFSDVVTVFVNG